MEINEYEMVQIEKESKSNVFNDDFFDLSRVKLEPCQTGMYGYKSNTDLIEQRNASFKFEEQKAEKYGSAEKNTEDVDFTDLSTTCKGEQINSEDDIDIHYEDVKTELDERRPGDNGHYEMCNRNVVSESTSILCSTSGKVHEKIRLEERQLQCKICSKAFSSKCYLKRHERIHTGEKPFHCQICLKSFTETGNLKVHERVHTGEKPFHCKICSKSFTNSSNLKKHERIHSGSRPFHCTICSKTFTRSSNLKVHEKIHTGEKPFQCNICTKAFTQSGNLKMHEKIHTREQTFKQIDAERA